MSSIFVAATRKSVDVDASTIFFFVYDLVWGASNKAYGIFFGFYIGVYSGLFSIYFYSPIAFPPKPATSSNNS
jgi:hypothetical protein